MSSENQQDLNSSVQSLTGESYATPTNVQKSPTLHRRIVALLRALKNSDFPHGGIVIAPNEELKVLPYEFGETASENSEFAASAELMDRNFS